ncbi:putative laccase-9, partial [Mucuna pruriens]
MWFSKKIIFLQILWFSFFIDLHSTTNNHYKFVVQEVKHTRLCHTTSILTVNGKFPGPTITAQKGDTVYVTVYNKGRYNITLPWYLFHNLRTFVLFWRIKSKKIILVLHCC